MEPAGEPASHRPVEIVVLERMFSFLVGSIDAASVLPDALSEGLITFRQWNDLAEVRDCYKCAEKFLGHLLRAANGDHEKFHTFLQVLKRTGQEKIAEHLRGSSHYEIFKRLNVLFSVIIVLTEFTREMSTNPDQGNLLFIYWYSCTV